MDSLRDCIHTNTSATTVNVRVSQQIVLAGQVVYWIGWAILCLRAMNPGRARFQHILPSRSAKREALHTSAQRVTRFNDLEVVYTSSVEYLSSGHTSYTTSKDQNLEVIGGAGIGAGKVPLLPGRNSSAGSELRLNRGR